MGTRAAHSLLDVLAEETWDLCWSFLSRLELHQITLVCRQFRRIGQARLFRSIRIHHIEFEAARYNGAGFRREHILFARQIECTNALAASAHAASMRELSFADPKNLRGIEPALNEQQTELVRVLVDTLCCYSNLGTLSLCGLDMDAALCESLLSLTRLKILSLSCCDPAFPTLAGRTVLSLTSLSITYRREHGWLARELALTDPNALKHLSIECEEGGTGSVPPLCSTSPPCLPALLSLSLSHVDWPPAQVRRLLELCPHLQKLTIDIDSDNAEAYSNVLETMLPTTIPELKILGCRTDLVPALVRGRPVVDVMILLNQQTLFPPGTAAESEARFDITQVLVAVRAMSLATSTSVRRLSIEHALPLKEEPLVELFAALRQHAPALEFLSLDLLDFGRNLRWSSTEGGPEGITEVRRLLFAKLPYIHQLTRSPPSSAPHPRPPHQPSLPPPHTNLPPLQLFPTLLPDHRPRRTLCAHRTRSMHALSARRVHLRLPRKVPRRRRDGELVVGPRS
ncbi:hypothetical protein C8F01DRAFT_1150422 [Mycena amicta]|nr:hypothetical protein C8F01DRAFT_1150422 [Mycena amicta]